MFRTALFAHVAPQYPTRARPKLSFWPNSRLYGHFDTAPAGSGSRRAVGSELPVTRPVFLPRFGSHGMCPNHNACWMCWPSPLWLACRFSVESRMGCDRGVCLKASAPHSRKIDPSECLLLLFLRYSEPSRFCALLTGTPPSLRPSS